MSLTILQFTVKCDVLDFSSIWVNTKIWTNTLATDEFSGYWRILELIIRMRNPYFLISHASFILFRFCQGIISTNSVRRVQVSWLYKETLALQKSSCHDQVYHSFRGRLTSRYQVVRNQWTPLVIVQIVLDLVTPSPF